MIRRIVVFVLAAALVAPAALAWAAADDAAAVQRGHHGSSRFQQWLGLTDDQMTQIRDIRQKDAESWKQVGSSLRKAQTELRQLALSGGSPDTLQAKQTEVQQLLGQMVQLRVKGLQEVAPLLTQEQRDKLAEGRPGARHHRGRPQPQSQQPAS